MRSPLRRGFMLAVVAAAILPGTASAAATIQPSGAVAFTGNNVGSTVITYAGGTPSTSCTTVTLTGTKIAGTPTVLEFTPVFSGCTTTIISSRPATLTSLPPGCKWRLSVAAATFNVGTGATTGLSLTTCQLVKKVPSIPACTTTFAAQTINSGLTAQNRTSGDAGNAPASGTAAAFRLILSAAPITYTSSGCPGVGSGTASMSGTWYFPGIWVGP